MAEKGVIGDAAKKLEHEITCPLCLGPLDNPKRLPCDHIYCKSPCLEGLLKDAGNSIITCPECRNIAQVQNNDLDNLPNAFQIERLKDLHSEMAQASATSSTPARASGPEPAQSQCQTCPTHPTQLQEFYCETCHEVVCSNCILLDSQHRDHKYCSVSSEVAEKQRRMIAKDLLDVEKLEAQSAKTLAEVRQAEVDVAKQRREITEQVTTSFDAVFRFLEEQKQALLDNTNQQVEQMLASITAEISYLGAASSQLQRSIESAKDALAKDGNYDFLSKMCELKTELAEARRKTTVLLQRPTPQPVLKATIQLPSENFKLTPQACRIDRVDVGPDPSKCKVDGEGHENGEMGKEITVVVKLVNERDVPCYGNVTAELNTLRDGSAIQAEVVALSQSQFQISYTPATRGRHELNIKVNGEDVAGSPFRVFIQIPLQCHAELKDPVATITGVKSPTRLYFSGERILVSDYGQVLVYNRRLKRVAHIGGGKMSFLSRKLLQLQGCGESATDRESNVYITTVGDNCLHKFSRDGGYITTVTGTGHPGGRFDSPNGMCVFSDSLYVCDTNNARVLEFDKSLYHLSTIKTKPKPTSVDIDATGRMYVCINDTPGCIQVLERDRELLYKHVRDINHSALRHPVTAKMFNGLLYVTDVGNNCVVVFTLLGEYVDSFGHAHLVRPEGIAIDDDGYIYVTNNQTNVHVF